MYHKSACLIAIVTQFVCSCSSHHKDPGIPQPLDTIPSIELGPQETLLRSGQLGLTYFPDEGTALVARQPTLSLMLTARDASYIVEGSSLQQLTRATQVLGPGSPGEFDNGYAGISAVIRLSSTYYGFYHAEDHEGLPPLPGNIPGFYASVGLARSDDGVTWRKVGQVLVSNQSKTYTAYPNQGDRGLGEPGAVVSRDGRYVYLYYTEHSRLNGRGVDICVARADVSNGPPLPGTFRKYYLGNFSEPGIGGKDSPVVTASEFDAANALEGHVTYSAKVQKYLMVFGVDAYKERTSGMLPLVSGLYSAWSSDAVSWSRPKRLITDYAVPQQGRSLSWEASVLFDDDQGGNGVLIYGYTPSWGTVPHYMVARRMSVSR